VGPKSTVNEKGIGLSFEDLGERMKVALEAA
jgi:hypothetical protein